MTFLARSAETSPAAAWLLIVVGSGAAGLFTLVVCIVASSFVPLVFAALAAAALTMFIARFVVASRGQKTAMVVVTWLLATSPGLAMVGIGPPLFPHTLLTRFVVRPSPAAAGQGAAERRMRAPGDFALHVFTTWCPHPAFGHPLPRGGRGTT